MEQTAEHQRLTAYHDHQQNWKNWGPYLSERAWGTVREDYSEDGEVWEYFPHDHARSRTYRWNEDGLAGISDRNQYLCFALALWNGKDPILKERLFGLDGHQGNHGEDVKEAYFYLDNTPTHSYMQMLYKYPQNPFPYETLIRENAQRGYQDPEFELIDTGIFNDDRYFDVYITYGKASPNDILIEISVLNRGPETATIHLLPTLWFRNTWSWGYENGPMSDVPGKPVLREVISEDHRTLQADHPTAGKYYLYLEGGPELLFTENETNSARLFSIPNTTPFVKDAFHRLLINGEQEVVSFTGEGTKAAAWYQRKIPADAQTSLYLRLSQAPHEKPFRGVSKIIAQRKREADVFYQSIHPSTLSENEAEVQRRALAGMLWSKQLYYYDVEQWLRGDPGMPKPSPARKEGRNSNWIHLNNFDVISMPDKWEYPWYATWDLAFHCLPLAMVDPDYAKRQLILFTREWFMHPNGQLPAYEWSFEDVNPPVHAWAVWQVYQIDSEVNGKPDRTFLERVFHKLLLNFTWWTNRKDEDGNNIFQGGFLGLDNISVFNRSEELPLGGHIDQSDGTAWMGTYCLTMLKISLELAKDNPVYQDTATKFFEHFLSIAQAMTDIGGKGYSLWNEEDGFFYDVLHLPDGAIIPLKVRSLVGLIPLFAVETLEPELLDTMPDFMRRMNWFLQHRPHLAGNIASVHIPGKGNRRLLAIVTPDRLARVLTRLLDETEFLSPYGIRSLSKFHQDNPYVFTKGGMDHTVHYSPAESRSGLYGGNSNWRGPVWFPINYLLIESLKKFYRYFGDDFKVECPTGSGIYLTLQEIAEELSNRLIRLFLNDDQGRRPINGRNPEFWESPNWRDLILFYEYFHGDNGTGLGANHQTGWTGLVANLIQETNPR